MKFPMDPQQAINQFEEENGKQTNQEILVLFSVIVEILNKTYTEGVNGVEGGIFPIEKDKIPQVVDLMLSDNSTGLKNTVEMKEWLIYFLSLGNDVFKQGQIDGYKEINSKLA